MKFLNLIENIRKSDQIIWFAFVCLSVISVLAVYSSTRSLAFRVQGGNTEFYLIKHLSVVGLGLFIAYFVYYFDHKSYSKVAKISLLLSIVLLLFTLIFGKEVNEAKRCIMIPVINLSFQTSDLAKLALIMYTSRTLAANQEVIKDFKDSFIPLMVPIVIVCEIIMLENMSTALILLVTNLIT